MAVGSDWDRRLRLNTDCHLRYSSGLRSEAATAHYWGNLCRLRHYLLFVPQLTAAKLNTAVSILATLSRASVIFVAASVVAQQKWLKFVRSRDPLSLMLPYDDATRGPLGAISLLLSGPKRYVH